ncbi:hypothetical protein C6370_05205 [Bacillus atrophaeus]|nr:hypothetical protein C6370_05205 [Bacillus atrophaeus]
MLLLPLIEKLLITYGRFAFPSSSSFKLFNQETGDGFCCRCSTLMITILLLALFLTKQDDF